MADNGELTDVPPESHLSVEDLVAALDPPMLASQQLAVLEYASYGLGHRETAAEMNLSPLTVKLHRERVKTKLKVRKMVEAVGVGFDTGWLNLDPEDQRQLPSKELAPTEHWELIMAASGLKAVEAANKREVAEKTVKNIRSNVLEKLNAVNMCHAVRRAREAGILTYEDPSLEWLDTLDYSIRVASRKRLL